MAVLSSTSPGQLSKYVIPTVESINSGRVSTATKTYTLKKSTQNEEAVKAFLQLGMGGSRTQKDALNIVLETTDSRNTEIRIGSLNKPNIKYNLGDMAEGVVGAAICARFIYKNRNITARQVYGVLRSMGAPTNYPGKKGKQVEKTFKSANLNPKIMDDVRLFISLAEVNMVALLSRGNENLLKEYVESAVKYANSPNVTKWSKLVYENNRYDKIEVLSDGLGGQRSTKVDVSVKITDDKGKLMPVDILVSLKAGDVKQFGQVSGAEFVKQQDLWGRLFGYDASIKGLEEKYTDLMFMKKKPDEAVSLVYEFVNRKLNGDLQDQPDKILRNLANAINYFATLNEENVTLLQVGQNRAKVYKFDDIYNRIKGKKYESKIVRGKSNLPTILIESDGKPLIQFRVKQEFKNDGSPYVRNYIEKQKLMAELLGETL
tara:strand:- start:189 stop:1484 length:1296 start_codon:yes stop_codon:yes gene_type:complete